MHMDFYSLTTLYHWFNCYDKVNKNMHEPMKERKLVIYFISLHEIETKKFDYQSNLALKTGYINI